MHKETLIYTLLFLIVTITMFEAYRTNLTLWNERRKTDKKIEALRQEMYATVCNTFVSNCQYMFDSGVLLMPPDWDGTREDLILSNFFTMFPQAEGLIKRTDVSDDSGLEDSDSLSEGRS